MKFYAVLAIFLAIFELAAASTPGAISSCQQLDTAGTYYLNASVSSNATCFNVNANSVTIDCRGFSITGNNATGTYGIYTTKNYVNVLNCTVSNFNSGIWFNGASFGRIENTKAYTTAKDNLAGFPIYNSGIALTTRYGTLWTPSYGNVVTDSYGYSEGSVGVNLMYGGYTFNKLTRVTGETVSGHGMGVDHVWNDRFINCTGKAAGSGIALNFWIGGNHYFENFKADANTGYGVVMTASNVTMNGLAATVQGSLPAFYVADYSSNNVIANGTLYSAKGNAIYFDVSTVGGPCAYGSTFYSNTLSAPGNTTVYVAACSYGNLFYWNNFTSTTGLHVNDLNGNNHWNATEGNVWSDVMDRTVAITGTAQSTGFAGLLVGSAGTGYPYGKLTSGKVIGNVVDYAPITPLPPAPKADVSVVCGTGGAVCTGSATGITLPATLPISATAASEYVFSNWSVSGNCTPGNATSNVTNVTVNSNCTVAANFAVKTKKASSLELSASPSWKVTAGTQTQVACTASAPGIIIPHLYVNGLRMNNPDTQLLSPGSYYYTCNANGNENYTAPAQQNNTLVVTRQMNVTLVSQTPAYTLAMMGMNLIYSITPSNYVNNSTVIIYYGLNGTNCTIFVGGTCADGAYSQAYTSVTGANYLFSLLGNRIYPGNYNYPEEAMESTPHLNLSSYIEKKKKGEKKDEKEKEIDAVKMAFSNVSNNAGNLAFEIMASAVPGSHEKAHIYVCNESYGIENGKKKDKCDSKDMEYEKSKSCGLLAEVPSTAQYDHVHSINSAHLVFDAEIANGKVAGVKVTPTMYFIFEGEKGKWDVGYIADGTGTAEFMEKKDKCWSSLEGTIDAHLHQPQSVSAGNFYQHVAAESIQEQGGTVEEPQ